MKITQIARNNKTSSAGKPYISLGIQVDDPEHAGKWINGFGNKDNANWNVGDDVDIEIVHKGNFLNFETAKTHQTVGTGYQPSADGVRMERKVDAILTEIQMIKTVLGDILQKVDKVNTDSPF